MKGLKEGKRVWENRRGTWCRKGENPVIWPEKDIYQPGKLSRTGLAYGSAVHSCRNSKPEKSPEISPPSFIVLNFMGWKESESTTDERNSAWKIILKKICFLIFCIALQLIQPQWINGSDQNSTFTTNSFKKIIGYRTFLTPTKHRIINIICTPYVVRNYGNAPYATKIIFFAG